MRRRQFIVRMSIAGAGSLAFGCDGYLTTERIGPPPPMGGGDAGPLPPDAGDAPPDAGPGGQAPDPHDAGAGAPPSPPDAGGGIPAPRDGGPGPGVPQDAGPCPSPRTVSLHDVHAQALYFDGTYGPTTGLITVDHIVEGRDRLFEFWHGHGGTRHRFTVTAADFAQLARGERVTLTTSEVDGHSHELFIDPVGETWRASPDQSVELC